MKVFIVFSSLVAIGYGITPELMKAIKDHAIEVGTECKNEIDVSDEDIAPLLTHTAPTSDKGKCFVACIFKKEGLQDASGKINKDGGSDMLDKLKPLDPEYCNKAKEVAEICLDATKDADNECDTAASLFTCLQAEKVKAGMPEIDFED